MEKSVLFLAQNLTWTDKGGGSPGLNKLWLDDNRLDCLPETFCDLQGLQELALERNFIVFLPDNFGRLTALRTLYLAANELMALPRTFVQLEALRDVTLDENRGCKITDEHVLRALPLQLRPEVIVVEAAAARQPHEADG